ncbi:PD-(D/E)XK nuclease family protein [Candidatus Parcubacteria bacterium]|nr:PD-(D/E)XK nuclease family protein [Candidatus Parcubacteria bacterium]
MKRNKYPIKHWSYSSLVTYLRNPLAWHKRYVEGVFDTPATPASVIGRAAHTALEHYYKGGTQEFAIEQGLLYLREVPDFEINFGKAESLAEKKKKRAHMEAEYRQAVSFYLAKPPRHKVLGVEVKVIARIPGIDIPVKAISDLVVESRTEPGAVDIVDHKFMGSFGSLGLDNPLFMIQALFNYYTVLSEFGRPVGKFIVYECKKTKNKDGKPQLRKHVIDFREHEQEFLLFHRLLSDATKEIRTRKIFLPNPSDMFEGKNSLEIYRWGLIE